MNMIPFLNKTLLPLLLALGLSAGATTAIPDIRIINAGLGKHFGLKINGLEGESAVFTVATPTGEALFSKEVAGQDYQSIFSLEAFDEGRYVFILRLKDVEIQQPVQVTKRAILHDIAERRVIALPQMTQSQRQINLDIINASGKACTLLLYNDQEEVVYRETIKGRSDIQKQLALSDLPTGNYRIVVTTAQFDWQRDIALR